MPVKPKSEFDTVHCTPDQIRELKKDIAETERMLKEDSQRRTPKISDPAEVMKEVRKKKQILVDHEPKPFKSTAQQNQAYAATKKLAKFISDNMPPKRDYYRMYPKQKDRHGNPINPDHMDQGDFDRAVNWQIKFQTDPNMQKAVRLYKHLMRRLDPSDPTITNIERLRR